LRSAYTDARSKAGQLTITARMRGRRKGAQLVHDRRDRLLALSVSQALIPGPERFKAISSVSPATALRRKSELKAAPAGRRGHARPVCQGEQRRVEDVLVRGPSSLGRGRGRRPIPGRRPTPLAFPAGEHVEAHRPRLVCRIEHGDVVAALRRMRSRTPSMRCPWGRRRLRRAAMMSWTMRPWSSVDLPVPVGRAHAGAGASPPG